MLFIENGKELIAISFKLYRVLGGLAVASAVVCTVVLHLVYYFIGIMGPSAADIYFVVGLPWEVCPLLFAALALAMAGSLCNRPVLWVLAAAFAGLFLYLCRIPSLLSAVGEWGEIPFLLGLSAFFGVAGYAVLFCCMGAAFTLVLHRQQNKVDEFYGDSEIPPAQGQPFRVGCGTVFLALLALPILISTIYLGVSAYSACRESLDTSVYDEWQYSAWEYARFPSVEYADFPRFDDERLSDPEYYERLAPWERIEGYRSHISPSPVGLFASFEYIPGTTLEELQRLYEENTLSEWKIIATGEGIDGTGRAYTELAFLYRGDDILYPLQYVERWYSVDGDMHIVSVAFLTSKKRSMLIPAGQAYLDRVILVPEGGADTPIS